MLGIIVPRICHKPVIVFMLIDQASAVQKKKYIKNKNKSV